MSLPILQNASARSTHDRLRLFLATELQWTQHVATQMDLAAGSAFANPALSRLPTANRVLATPAPGIGADQAIAEVDRHFDQQGARCLQWVFGSPAATPQETALAAALLRQGYAASSQPIMSLSIAPAALRLGEVAGLTVIPARASYRHAQLMADALAEEASEPQWSIERMLHLDDPHCEGLLALSDGRVVGSADVLTVGDVGRIDGLYVVPTARGRGIGRTLLSRAIEICARAAFREVVLGSSLGESRQQWWASAGFGSIGDLWLFSRT